MFSWCGTKSNHISFFFCSFQNKSDTSAALAALFGMMYEYGDSIEETVFKNTEELNALQKFDYVLFVKNNKEKLLDMYERTKELLADK